MWSAFVPLCRRRFNKDIQWSFREQSTFRICTILPFKYRQNNTQCTPLSSHSEKHQQRAGLLYSGQSTFVSDTWIVALRPSVPGVPCLQFTRRRGVETAHCTVNALHEKLTLTYEQSCIKYSTSKYQYKYQYW